MFDIEDLPSLTHQKSYACSKADENMFVFMTQFPTTSEGYQVVQEKLSMRGAALNAAASDMVSASRGTSNQLAVSTKKFSLSYQDLLDSGLKLAGQAKVRLTFLWFLVIIPWQLKVARLTLCRRRSFQSC